jgi:hypothetical protein
MAQPTSEFIQRRFVSQVSKTDALVGKQNWRDTAVFHVRGLLLSFSFYRFLLIRKIRNTYFKVKLLSGVSKFLAIRRKNHLSFRHTNRLRRLSLNYDRNLNAATLDYLSLEFLLTHMFGQEGAVFAYDVPPPSGARVRAVLTVNIAYSRRRNKTSGLYGRNSSKTRQ